MRDFHNCNVDDVNNTALRKRLSYFKESKEGNDNMSEYIQRVYKEDFDKLRIDTKLDDAIAVAESLNISIDNTLELLKLDDDLRQKILARMAEKGIKIS